MYATTIEAGMNVSNATPATREEQRATRGIRECSGNEDWCTLLRAGERRAHWNRDRVEQHQEEERQRLQIVIDLILGGKQGT